jgi:hypothetical protein
MSLPFAARKRLDVATIDEAIFGEIIVTAEPLSTKNFTILSFTLQPTNNNFGAPFTSSCALTGALSTAATSLFDPF